MMTSGETKRVSPLIIGFLAGMTGYAQQSTIKWSNDGNSYYRIESNEVLRYNLPANSRS